MAGWMTQSDEDYQRTFGIVPAHPQNISLLERLYRFYRVNDPSHLPHVKEEAMMYTDSSGSSRTLEPDRLYRQLRKKYPTLDPTKRDDLTMPMYIPPRLLSASCRVYLALIVERLLLQHQLMQYKQRMMEFTNDMSEQAAEQQRIRHQITAFDSANDLVMKCGYRKKPQVLQVGDGDNQQQPSLILSTETPPPKPPGRPSEPVATDTILPPTKCKQSTDLCVTPQPDVQSSSSSSLAPTVPENTSNNSATVIPAVATSSPTASTTVNKVAAVADDKEPSLSSLYWDWNDLPLSCTHEYYLLRWETELQLELGTLVEAYMRSIRDAVVQNVIEKLFFYSLASAVALPTALLNVSAMILY